MRYLIATQRTDGGDPNIIEGRVITRFAGGTGLVTEDEREAYKYADGDAQTVRDDLHDQFPHYRFYLVEV